MGQAHDRVRDAGGDVVAVFQYRAQPTRNYCRQRGVPFDCLADPERAVYTGVGLDRGRATDYVNPKVAMRFLSAVRTGGAPGKPEPHAQRPGTFVVARGGEVALAHYNRDPADNPPIDSLIAAVRGATRTA